MSTFLIQGDPLDPSEFDILAVIETLPVGDRVPQGWTVLTGNTIYSQVGYVALRCNLERTKQ